MVNNFSLSPPCAWTARSEGNRVSSGTPSAKSVTLYHMDYFNHMQQRLANQEKFVPGRLGDKKLVRQFADLIGVQTPLVFFRGPLTSLKWSTLPAEFVLKPAFASTSIGVMLLRKNVEGNYENLLNSSLVTVEEDRKSVV